MKLQDIDNEALYITMALFLLCFVVLSVIVVAVCVVVHFWEIGCRWPAWVAGIVGLAVMFVYGYHSLKEL